MTHCIVTKTSSHLNVLCNNISTFNLGMLKNAPWQAKLTRKLTMTSCLGGGWTFLLQGEENEKCSNKLFIFLIWNALCCSVVTCQIVNISKRNEGCCWKKYYLTYMGLGVPFLLHTKRKTALPCDFSLWRFFINSNTFAGSMNRVCGILALMNSTYLKRATMLN